MVLTKHANLSKQADLQIQTVYNTPGMVPKGSCADSPGILLACMRTLFTSISQDFALFSLSSVMHHAGCFTTLLRGFWVPVQPSRPIGKQYCYLSNSNGYLHSPRMPALNYENRALWCQCWREYSPHCTQSYICSLNLEPGHSRKDSN